MIHYEPIDFNNELREAPEGAPDPTLHLAPFIFPVLPEPKVSAPGVAIQYFF